MKKIYRVFLFFGFDPISFYYNITGIGWFLRDYFLLKKSLKSQTAFSIKNFFIILTDKREDAGKLPRHYFQQDLLIAQKIFKNNPTKHIDVGSRIDGFVANVASYRPIEIIDIRPLTSTHQNISFLQADMMKPLNDNLKNYADSVSCLHAIEHFGLGRYGDPIDAEGHRKGLKNITDILKPGGRFYFSTPISSDQRIEFNAHRVFSVPHLLNIFKEDYIIEEFYYINDEQELIAVEDVESSEAAISSFNCRYGCGIFILRKGQIH